MPTWLGAYPIKKDNNSNLCCTISRHNFNPPLKGRATKSKVTEARDPVGTSPRMAHGPNINTNFVGFMYPPIIPTKNAADKRPGPAPYTDRITMPVSVIGRAITSIFPT